MARNPSANYEQSLQDQWTKMFKRLQGYQQDHDGSCDVPQRYRQDPQLGTWAGRQRQKYKDGTLKRERCDQLEAIGFIWDHQQRWTKMLKRLQEYQREHNGSCNVSQRYHQDPQLGTWVKSQRCRYKKGLLTKNQCDRLEGIGFEWVCTNYEQSLHDEWIKMLKKLQAYQQEHEGSCDVPQRYHQDPQLGAWVSRQRARHKKGLLTKERCDQLEKVGFEWTCNRQWTKMLKRLQAYQQEHNGCCNVPAQYRQDPQLGCWVSRQRYYYKKGLLTKERYDQLGKIGFEWTCNREWNNMLKRLQAFQQEHGGSCNVPAQYWPDPQLGRWVSKQRHCYKKGLLTKERCDQLVVMGFQWTLNGARASSTQQQPPLSKVSATKQPDTAGTLRYQGDRAGCD